MGLSARVTVCGFSMVLIVSLLGPSLPNMVASQTPPNTAPATGCPPSIGLSSPVVTGLSVSVNGGTSPCGTGTSIASISWDWGDGTTSTSWFPANHTYCAAGTYSITATSHQSDGQTASASTSATVSGPSCPPAISLTGPVVSGQTVSVNGTVQLCAPGTSLTGISWTWGDGANSMSNLPAIHTYALTGSFAITATAHSSDGSTATGYVTVAVPGQTNFLQSIGPRAIGGDPCSPGLTGAGKMQAFAMNQSYPMVMYAGGGIGPGSSGPSSQAGLFKSVNEGASWFPINNGLTDPMVDSVWIDQHNSSMILASTYNTGIFRSTDSGNHWTLVYSGSAGNFGQDGSMIYAAAANGVAQSTDAGATWSIVSATSAPARAIAVSGGTVYAGLDNGNIIARLTPTSSWQTVFTDAGHYVWSLAIDPTNTQTAFAVEFFNYQTNNLYVTHNGGTTWTTVPAPGPLGVQYVALNASQPKTIYVGEDLSFYRSTDGGQTFSSIQIPFGGTPDIRYINAYPQGPLIVGSDQGLFASNDEGTTWQSLNGNLATSLLTGIAVSHHTILTAVQDYSPITSFDNGSTWLVSSGIASASGEDGTAVFNPGNSSYAYMSTSVGNGVLGFFMSTDGGRDFTKSNQVGGDPFPFQGTNNLIAVDPNSPSTVYVVTNTGIYSSSNWGISLAREPWSFNNPSLVVVSPTDSQTIFVGDNAGLHFTKNGGSTWSTSSLSGANGSPATLAIDPLNTSIILVGLSGAAENGGGVWKSTDAGTSFAAANTGITTQPIVTGIAIWKLSFQPGTQIVAAATTHGLYVSQNKGQSWNNYSGNTTPYWFTDLAWLDNYLYASTYGEGIVRLAFDFSLANSGDISLNQGLSGSNTITVAMSQGIPESINLACTSGMPSGATCTFNPVSALPAFASTLTLSTTPSTPTGSYIITVTATGTGLTHATQFLLTVSSASVGGTVVPSNKFALLEPYVGVILLVFSAITAVLHGTRSRKHPKRKTTTVPRF